MFIKLVTIIIFLFGTVLGLWFISEDLPYGVSFTLTSLVFLLVSLIVFWKKK